MYRTAKQSRRDTIPSCRLMPFSPCRYLRQDTWPVGKCGNRSCYWKGPHRRRIKERDDVECLSPKKSLSWVIIGPVCTESLHIPENINVNKTHILQNGRPSLLHPCDNRIQLKDHIFIKTEHDERMALSTEDDKFVELMEISFRMANGRHHSHSELKDRLCPTRNYKP